MSEMKETERENYGSGRSTCSGYIAEWRLKPGSVALCALLPYSDVGEKWSRANYDVAQLPRLGFDTQSLIRPYIPQHDWGKAEHHLLDKDVALAVVACLKTSIKQRLLEHIEWRIVRIRLEATHKLTREDGNSEEAKRRDEIEDVFNERIEDAVGPRRTGAIPAGAKSEVRDDG